MHFLPPFSKNFPNLQDLLAIAWDNNKNMAQGPHFPYDSWLEMNLGSANSIWGALFITHDMQGTSSLEEILMQDQRKSSDLHSKCWCYLGIHELNILKIKQENVIWEDSISSAGPETLSDHPFKLWGLVFNSAEAHVGFTDKPVIAYLVEKSTAL